MFGRHHGLEGEDAFSAFLTDQAFAYAASKQLGAGDCLFYADAKALVARENRAAAQDEAEWKELFESEIQALKDQLNQLEDEKEESFRIASQVGDEREYYKGENARLRVQNDAIRRALEEKTGSGLESNLTLPSSFDEVEEWVGRNLVGRLELHPRASRGLRRAEFEDIELVCNALLLLARQYRDMRLGYGDAREAFEARSRELGLKLGTSISDNRAGEQGEEYFVTYPIGSQRREFLEYHLKKGTGHDQRHCLRIYFFWHDESQQVVVGWLPGHLRTRAT
ncbi:MAG: hypothetical protein ACC649_05895 [Myxococcota bacterium]